VTLAVVRGSLAQIADEMDLHLIHAALSPIISETNDCAHGIFDPETGQSFLANILEKGGSKNAMELFTAFRGREPSIEPLLRHSGIAV